MRNNITCPVAEITMTSDRRKIDQNKVGELAQSIRNVGLINPITITADRQLVAGAHRLEACRSLGMSDIPCIIFDGSDLQKELAEIDENLIRLELDPISIGELAIRRDEILNALGQRAKSGTNVKNSRTGAPGAPVPKTTETIAAEAGMSPRALQENKQLARDLTPKAKDGNWYFCVLGTDCDDCDIDCEDASKCEYKTLCSCFTRKEFGSVVYKYAQNLSDILDELIYKNNQNNDLSCTRSVSDEKEQFSTGAVRDNAGDKPRPELISPFVIERLAAWLRDGAYKYGDRNWETGMPTERTVASLLRHIMKYMQGDRTEDNLAAIMCNAMFLLDVDEKVKRGILPKSLLNLPVYPSNKEASKHISPFAKERLEKWLQSDSDEWNGIITAQKCLDKMFVHLRKFKENKDFQVDHITAALANLMRIVHIDEGVKRGLLPASLLDFPCCQQCNNTVK